MTMNKRVIGQITTAEMVRSSEHVAGPNMFDNRTNFDPVDA